MHRLTHELFYGLTHAWASLDSLMGSSMYLPMGTYMGNPWALYVLTHDPPMDSFMSSSIGSPRGRIYWLTMHGLTHELFYGLTHTWALLWSHPCVGSFMDSPMGSSMGWPCMGSSIGSPMHGRVYWLAHGFVQGLVKWFPFGTFSKVCILVIQLSIETIIWRIATRDFFKQLRIKIHKVSRY